MSYTGKNGGAAQFVAEMEGSGIAPLIRQRDGNLRYDYFTAIKDPETVLLVDSWADQAALDAHHASPQMAEIMALREKYDLHMTAQRLQSDEDGWSDHDRSFIRE